MNKLISGRCGFSYFVQTETANASATENSWDYCLTNMVYHVKMRFYSIYLHAYVGFFLPTVVDCGFLSWMLRHERRFDRIPQVEFINFLVNFRGAKAVKIAEEDMKVCQNGLGKT